MRSVSSARTRVSALVVAIVAVGSVSVATSGAATPGATAATKAQTVTASAIAVQPGTLQPGSRIRPGAIFGERVFIDRQHGFALASTQGADYPVATDDGGRTWKTDGPALHLHALQAPLAVVFIGAIGRSTVYAWGGGGQVIDSTSDGGRHWYRALFPNGDPVAVVQDLQHHLLAFVASFSGAATSRYVSTDGGRTWHH